MVVTEFNAALNQVANERNIKPEDVLATLKEALIAAYRKELGIEETKELDLSAKVDENTGEIKIFEGKKDVTPSGFGRISSQTAKQVILQKIREAEKASIAEEYREQIGTVIQGYIFRIDNGTVIMDVGKTQGILPVGEQIQGERYVMNQKYKVLIKEITDEESGSQIILSRRDNKFIEALFEMEVPEIENGVVKIERIARESGKRTKIAVSSTDPKIDPSGACIGQRGVRVQAVTDELNGEKIDIINYSPDADKFIAAALSPATVIDVVLDQETQSAAVTVTEDKLSLAIGNQGQNARLAAKLTGWKITVNGTEINASKTEETSEDPDEKGENKDDDKKEDDKKEDDKEVVSEEKKDKE